jgi:putative transposase
MAQATTPRFRSQLHRLPNPPAPQPELGLEGILPKATIMQVLTEQGGSWKSILYTPWVTFGTFFWPMLSPDRCCRSALKRLTAGMGLHGQKLDHEDTSPYCTARARLPESALRRRMRWLGANSPQRVPEDWRGCGRRVQVVDGSTTIMADTAANQRADPQSRSQKPGLGFPITRLVGIFCLATGSVLELALGQDKGKQTGETAWFRSLWDRLEREDLILGDRDSGADFELALLKQRGVDGEFRLHPRRPSDFGLGRRLGKQDQIVTGIRPQRPDWMDKDTYNTISETMEIRLVRIQVGKPGVRTQVLDLATTLIDPDMYTTTDLALLFRQRWHAELDLRSIQVVMGLDLLRCKTPEMVRKELGITWLGDNVIRALIVAASPEHGGDPRRVSFKWALQTLQEFAAGLRTGSPAQGQCFWVIGLISITGAEVGHRPDRVEPPARKRRPKPYPWLNKPRWQAKAALLNAS